MMWRYQKYRVEHAGARASARQAVYVRTYTAIHIFTIIHA